MAIRELSVLAVGLLCVGLIAIFAGEHAFAHSSLSSSISWLGILAVAVATGMRGYATMKSSDSHRKIELVSAACNLGLLFALAGYYLSTSSGMELLGIDGEATVTRWKMVMTVLWVIALFVSMVPLIMVTIVRSTGRTDSDSTVDLMQVREMASSGLSIALAASFLMVTCNIADQRNIRRDVSYFKTSDPGTATVRMLESLNEPLRVLTFFPENNEVAGEVKHYFDSLGATSTNFSFSQHDRLIESGLAKEHKVSQEGTIVLLRGESSKKFTIPTKIEVARGKTLREFDGEFQKNLMAVLRDTKTAYFLVGHGELNDPGSAGAISGKGPLLKSTLIKSAFKQLNYKTKDYEGFGKRIPDDCSVLVVLAPQVALMEDELQAIDDYLGRGGSAIIALDPEAGMRLGPLQKRLGVAFNPAPIADDKEFMVRTRSISDHSLLLTNQFLSHASISTMGRGNARAAILFVQPGSFDEVALADELKDTKRAKIIRTMQTAFRDNGGGEAAPNFSFDEKSEKRDRYAIAMAIENEKSLPDNLPEGAVHTGMRVVLLADREVLSDGILARVAVVQDMLVDMIKWTGGEEAFSGKTTSEKDKPIEHSKSEDTVWFYGTIIAAPLLVLLIGLFYVGRRNRRFIKIPRGAKGPVVAAKSPVVAAKSPVAANSLAVAAKSPAAEKSPAVTTKPAEKSAAETKEAAAPKEPALTEDTDVPDEEDEPDEEEEEEEGA